MRRLCQVLGVHPSGYYAWRRNAYSTRHHEDQRLLALMKPSWLESGRVYGYRKVIWIYWHWARPAAVIA